MSRSKNQYIWTFSNPAFDFKSAACSLVNFLFPFLEPLSLPNSPSVPIKVVCDAINASLTLYNCSEYNCSDYFACSTYPNTDGATIAASIASMTSTTIISTNVKPFCFLFYSCQQLPYISYNTLIINTFKDNKRSTTK